MNVQHSLIRELLIYEFKLGQNDAEGNRKKIVVPKVKVQLDSVWFKKFRSDCKNINDQKTIDSGAMFQAVKENSACSTERVSGGLSISQSCMVHLYDFNISIGNCRIVPRITKIE